MSHKYKVGDRVVRVNCMVGLHERGTVFDNQLQYGTYGILEDSGVEHWWDEDKTELEAVFDSPLYQALK